MIEDDFNKLTVGFIGLGLIGGSIAKAMRIKYPDISIMAYEFRESLSLDNELGLKEGVLNEVTDSLDDFSRCDLIFLCAPVIQNVKYLASLKKIVKEDCIITDVGSVKANIHQSVSEHSLESNFIGGHPMTGSEKSGFSNASPKLFENAYYILTPTSQTSKRQKDFMVNLVKTIGAIPIILDYYQHDKIVAAISHLPHIVAASLVNLVKYQENDRELMKDLAAGGFRDITRIASSSPDVWENISIANSLFIKDLINQYISLLEDIAIALDNKDNAFIHNTFSSAKEFRNALPKKGKGIIEKIFEIYMDIDDEAGAIATVATLLAKNRISIKNIGIIHNREFQDGVLRIEFYEDSAMVNAINLLKDYKYTIYER
ncbi:MAG: prephenate dehydrogenase [Clostridiales bacterium]|nr:prephenate dehydrogenase [Clostridiales bacterium]